jgi:hypothetical protein
MAFWLLPSRRRCVFLLGGHLAGGAKDAPAGCRMSPGRLRPRRPASLVRPITRSLDAVYRLRAFSPTRSPSAPENKRATRLGCSGRTQTSAQVGQPDQQTGNDGASDLSQSDPKPMFVEVSSCKFSTAQLLSPFEVQSITASAMTRRIGGKHCPASSRLRRSPPFGTFCLGDVAACALSL